MTVEQLLEKAMTRDKTTLKEKQTEHTNKSGCQKRKLFVQGSDVPRSLSKRSRIGRDTSDFEAPSILVYSRPGPSVTNHSYRDYSQCPFPKDDLFVSGYKSDDSESIEKSFALKMHEILGRKDFQGYAAWNPHGRSFNILIPKRFELKVCPIYFNHARYSSFLKQLTNHGFKHITQGRDRNSWYHEVRRKYILFTLAKIL
mmetsp:Transcript_15235/g.21725  ORF Transcript_15235/g.21725 Transcript_15235/m.21725 type:complete len:200 (+) Transcript_15235:59-658(+)